MSTDDHSQSPASLTAVRRELWTSLGLVCAMAAALGVTMCTRRPGSDRPPEVATNTEDSAPAGENAPTTSEVDEPRTEARAAATDDAALDSQPKQPLSGFLRALHDVKQGERNQPVHVVWLGDSHTAADFWSQAVRSGLQQEFGNAGPGFIHVGLKAYRHGAAKLTTEGKWRLVPKAPASYQPEEEGFFGLGGMATVALDDRARTRVELYGDSLGQAQLAWRLAYRLPTDKSHFEVQLGAETHTVASMEDVSASGVAHVAFTAPASSELVIRHAVGKPELFGLVVEGERPGVVLDTLGINGARVLTAVSWPRDAWIEELERRDPSLVIIAYGANEVGDGQAPGRYREAYVELLERVRVASPDADCLILGTTERDLPDWTTNPRVLQIEQVQRDVAQELGCSFFSIIEAMGGPGGLRTWAFSKPPLASRDRIHLTPSGYRIIGEQLLQGLLQSYEQRFALQK